MDRLPLAELMRWQLRDFWSLHSAIPFFFLLCAVEGLLARPRGPAKPTPDLVTDLLYWSINPTVRIISRLLGVFALLALSDCLGVAAGPVLEDGFGALSSQPLWLIGIELLLLTDLLTYWLHRALHAIPWLWRFHAVHHSAAHVRWSTTGRIHPVNDFINYIGVVVPCFAMGLPLSAILPLSPLVNLWTICAHTAWDTDFGPLKRLVVSPRFHRFHHAMPDAGGNRNFANLFSFWDWLFGTYHLPSGERPGRLGLLPPGLPESYWGQFLAPFRRRRGPGRCTSDLEQARRTKTAPM